ncbi:hypothetical protein BLOT_008765, partial [Blomia tropicalis]
QLNDPREPLLCIPTLSVVVSVPLYILDGIQVQAKVILLCQIAFSSIFFEKLLGFLTNFKMIPRSINCLSASLIVFVLIVNLSLVPIDATKLSSNETSSTSSSTATTIDLDQSQSSQKDSMLDVSGDPIRLQSHSSTMDYQSVPHQQQSTSSAHSNDLSSVTSHAKQQHHHHHHHQQPKQMTVTYQGAPFNANQPISLKPGQFTLVSNQQIGPGHLLIDS